MDVNFCLGCMEELPEGEQVCPHCGYKVGTPVKEPYYLAPGSLLHGRYLIGRTLGSGGFGITYIGMDLTLRQKVAIKEYLPSDFATRMPGALTVSVFSGESAGQFSAGLEKFLDEARRLAALTNIPGVVRVMECFSENNTAYIVMELLEGRTLKQILKEEGKMGYEKAANIMIPVLYTLEAVHTQTWDDEKKSCIIHRDISPDNIFITNEGVIKLLDFGAARYASTYHSKSLSVILKPGYAPEEQYRSRGNQGPWSDVYAAAATFYKMLTGVTPEDAMERLNYDQLKPPRKLGVEMTENQENALMNALNVKAENRTQTAGEFAAQLQSESSVIRIDENLKKSDEGKIAAWVKWTTGGIGGLVAVLVALVFFGVLDPNPSHWGNQLPDGMVYTPSVVNMNLEKASDKLSKYEMQLTYDGKQYNDSVPMDMIISQDPDAGQAVRFGAEIHTVVSAGPEMVVVPDVTFLGLDEALETLEKLGFVVKTREKESDEYANGTVLEQNKLVGEKVKKGAEIELVYVKNGEEQAGIEKEIEMPDLKGKTFEEAKEILRQLGLQIQKTKTFSTTEYPYDTIIYQSVEGGDIIPVGTSVIQVGINVETKLMMPDVEGLKEEDARAQLELLGLRVEIRREKNSLVAKDVVINQSIDPDQEVKNGDTVVLVVSEGDETVVPDITGLTYESAVQKLESVGFRANRIDKASPTVEKGRVIKTDPEVGTSIKTGSTINVHVSTGRDESAKKIAVPSVLGYTWNDAQMTLEKLGLLARDGGTEYNETYAEGLVCLQNITDREVEAGTEIILTMSRGSRYVTLNQGSLLGLTQSEARQRLESMGLVYQYGGSVTDETYGEGTVCKQSTYGKLERGSTVTVTISKGSRYTSVSSMRNMSRSEASTYLNSLGLGIEFVEDWDETVSEGYVCKQSATGKVEKGSVITVTISRGSQYTYVPQVIGSTENSAKSAISSADLQFGGSTKDWSESGIAEGRVMRVDPSEGTRLKRGSTVSLVISQGSPYRNVKSYVNRPENEAVNGIQALGFTVERIFEPSETVASGMVIRQSVTNSKVDIRNTKTITIYVSSGSAYVALPSILGRTSAAAKSALEGQGFNFVQGDSVYNTEYPEGQVCDYTIDGEKNAAGKVLKGSTITVYVSLGSPYRTVRSYVNDTEASARAAVSAIQSQGFSVDFQYEHNEDVARGIIIWQSASGSNVDIRDTSTITFIVSRGTAGKRVKTSELANYPSSEYEYTSTETEYVYQVQGYEGMYSPYSSVSGYTRDDSRTEKSISDGGWSLSKPGSSTSISGDYEVKTSSDKSQTVYYFNFYYCSGKDYFWANNKLANCKRHGRLNNYWEFYSGKDYSRNYNEVNAKEWSGSKTVTDFFTGKSFTSNASYTPLYNRKTYTAYHIQKTLTRYYHYRWVDEGQQVFSSPMSNTDTKQYELVSTTEYTWVRGR